MIKSTQLSDWEQEPADERPSEFMSSRLSSFGDLSSFGALEPTARAFGTIPRRDAILDDSARRAPPLLTDRQLSRIVPRWLESLPPEAFPLYLCEHFPRIVNRLALCWSDPDLAVRLLDEFFLDERGTRQGFPAEASADLTRLHCVAAQRATQRAKPVTPADWQLI